ncbi:hypothetical protein QUF72_22055 [Desulfobacterales bacterium HSG2]|nr:hypothetical protein [Desulfobacterales bacterium HSG2]
MSKDIFTILLPLSSGLSKIHRKQKAIKPLIPNVNLKATKKKQVKKFIHSILKQYGLAENNPVFSEDDKLWLRIFYFNHESTTIDVHNIVKPTLDLLEGFVYPNDRNIKYLESVHLDMPSLSSDNPYFDIEIIMDCGINDMLKIYAETCFLIEAGIIKSRRILPTQSPVIKLTWL